MNFLYRLAMCILFTGFSLCLFPQTTGEIQRLEREISELRQLISRENANLQMMRNNSRNEGDIERLAYYIQTLEHSLVTKQKNIEYLRQQEAERLRREAELQRALEEKVREAQKKKNSRNSSAWSSRKPENRRSGKPNSVPLPKSVAASRHAVLQKKEPAGRPNNALSVKPAEKRHTATI